MSGLQLRPATVSDLPALNDLVRRWDTAWFGAPERSADEVAEMFTWIGTLETDSLLAFENTVLRGAALRWRTDTAVVADPDADARSVYDVLLPWIASGTPPHVDVLSRDEQLRGYVEAAGWQHRKSSFEMFRVVDDTLRLGAPRWPDGIAVRPLGGGQVETVYRLIYVDAGWAEVPGHPHRDFDEWQPIFFGERMRPDQQVLAWRDDRLVGAAVTRLWEDGTGWVSQLATARDERGTGLGRALLVEALTRQVAAGATTLGLSVFAENRTALGLYHSVGLGIDREWMEYTPARVRADESVSGLVPGAPDAD